MKSMTGYGKGEAHYENRQLSIELKSVNNRYLEINSRVPKALSVCDDIIRKIIQKNINRGSIDVYFNYENKSDDSKTVNVDWDLAKEYVKISKKMRTEFMLDEDFQTTALLRSPDVVSIQLSKDNPEIIGKLVTECITCAVRELDKMRQTEGETIKKDLTGLISNIIEHLKIIIERSPKVVEEYRLKIAARIKELLGSVQVDEVRLLNEVAFFADKADINEEISRLTSHIAQFTKSLEANDPQGRKLDFLTQEINREVNTIGSKCNDITLTNVVIAMKNEIEKIKEQIRNIE